MGAQSTYVVDSMIAFMCMACAVIYSGILGDVSTSLLTQWQVPGVDRTKIMIAVTLTLLYPMSLIKDLSALAFTSILGFCAIMYTVLFVLIRAVDGSYRLGSGQFVTGPNALKLLPSFAKSTWWNVNFSSLVLASNLGLAYIAHYNAPNFYRNLKDTNARRFANMVSIAFTILIALYAIIMVSGYSTFGDVCQGNILLNYHAGDILSTLGRVATFASIMFGFPLIMTGARESFMGVASSFGWDTVRQYHLAIVTTLLTVVTAIACTVQDVSLVVGLTGAALGSFIVYICPAFIYTKAVRQVHGKGSPQDRFAQWHLALVPFGMFIAGMGVYMTLQQ
jgi:sodium-coupled neutral amino acid transporter 11